MFFLRDTQNRFMGGGIKSRLCALMCTKSLFLVLLLFGWPQKEFIVVYDVVWRTLAQQTCILCLYVFPQKKQCFLLRSKNKRKKKEKPANPGMYSRKWELSSWVFNDNTINPPMNDERAQLDCSMIAVRFLTPADT